MPFDIEKTKVTPIYRNPVLDQAEVETITCDQMKEIYGELKFQKLHDDRGGDVRHDSERENSGVAERTAGEDVQQTQKSVAFQLAGIRRTLAQGVGVDARNHDETTQAEDQQQPDRVDDTFAQLIDLLDILERFYQFLVGRQKSDYHQKDDTNNEILIHNFWVLRLLTVFRRCPRLP